MKKVAPIISITGRGRSYLEKFLKDKGYEIYGMRRLLSMFDTQRNDTYCFCSAEVQTLFGDSSKASKEPSLKPSGTIDKLIAQMAFGDEQLAKEEIVLINRHSDQKHRLTK